MNCQHCTTATTNGLGLCKRCQQTTRSALDNIATYHGELLSIGAKEHIRTKKRDGISNPTLSQALNDLETPDALPADLAAEARTQLVNWMRNLYTDELIAASVPGAIRALQRDLPTIASKPWAGQFTHETLTLERRMRSLIARSKGSWYAGICSAITSPQRPHNGTSCACHCHNGTNYSCDIDGGCGTEITTIPAEECDRELYAQPGASYVRCPKCHTQHSVSQRRTILLDEARDTLLPISVIAKACVSLLDDEPSVEKFTKRIKKWTDRGDLIWVDNNGATRLYRVGDVLDLQARHAANPNGRLGWRKAC